MSYNNGNYTYGNHQVNNNNEASSGLSIKDVIPSIQKVDTSLFFCKVNMDIAEHLSKLSENTIRRVLGCYNKEWDRFAGEICGKATKLEICNSFMSTMYSSQAYADFNGWRNKLIEKVLKPLALEEEKAAEQAQKAQKEAALKAAQAFEDTVKNHPLYLTLFATKNKYELENQKLKNQLEEKLQELKTAQASMRPLQEEISSLINVIPVKTEHLSLLAKLFNMDYTPVKQGYEIEARQQFLTALLRQHKIEYIITTLMYDSKVLDANTKDMLLTAFKHYVFALLPPEFDINFKNLIVVLGSSSTNNYDKDDSWKTHDWGELMRECIDMSLYGFCNKVVAAKKESINNKQLTIPYFPIIFLIRHLLPNRDHDTVKSLVGLIEKNLPSSTLVKKERIQQVIDAWKQCLPTIPAISKLPVNSIQAQPRIEANSNNNSKSQGSQPISLTPAEIDQLAADLTALDKDIATALGRALDIDWKTIRNKYPLPKKFTKKIIQEIVNKKITPTNFINKLDNFLFEDYLKEACIQGFLPNGYIDATPTPSHIPASMPKSAMIAPCSSESLTREEASHLSALLESYMAPDNKWSSIAWEFSISISGILLQTGKQEKEYFLDFCNALAEKKISKAALLTKLTENLELQPIHDKLIALLAPAKK